MRKKARNVPDNCIIVKHPDGTVHKFTFTNHFVTPEGVTKWSPKMPSESESGPFFMKLTIEGALSKCDVCGQVWMTPNKHTRRECRLNVAKSVLED